MVLSSHTQAGSSNSSSFDSAPLAALRHDFENFLDGLFKPGYLQAFKEAQLGAIPLDLLEKLQGLEEHLEEARSLTGEILERLEDLTSKATTPEETTLEKADPLPFLRVRGLQLVDDAGVVRGSFDLSKARANHPQLPCLTFYNSQEQPLLNLGLWASDTDGVRELPIVSLNTMNSDGGLLDISGNHQGGLDVMVLDEMLLEIDSGGQVRHHTNEEP